MSLFEEISEWKGIRESKLPDLLKALQRSLHFSDADAKQIVEWVQENPNAEIGVSKTFRWERADLKERFATIIKVAPDPQSSEAKYNIVFEMPRK